MRMTDWKRNQFPVSFPHVNTLCNILSKRNIIGMRQLNTLGLSSCSGCE